MSVRFLLSGDTALIVEFGDRVDRKLNNRVLRLRAALRERGVHGVVETVPTYRSLMVLYDPLLTDSATLESQIEPLLHASVHEDSEARLWRIPGCYEPTHAPDLAEVAERTQLEAADVIDLHCGRRFHVYMLGFVPGFPYIGDLPEALALPRRTDPRVKVPAGSIAIAANMTAIYPVESPGGWHLIGATPIRLFDAAASRPALLNPGDEVVFEPIGVEEFDEIRAASMRGEYEVPYSLIAA